MSAKRIGLAAGLTVLLVAGCGGGSGSPRTASVSGASTVLPAGAGVAATDAAVIEMIEADIQDEYHAEAIYEGVLLDFGEVRPFANVVHAEVRHSESLARLFVARGLPVPASGWNVENVPRFGTLSAACSAAVEAERANIALYDAQLVHDLPRDVRNVLENNRAASIEAHLPAFERCR